MTFNQQRGPWKIDLSFDRTEIHVRPRGDLAWHPLSAQCPCRPAEDTTRLHDVDGHPVTLPVFLHTALDGRPPSEEKLCP